MVNNLRVRNCGLNMCNEAKGYQLHCTSIQRCVRNMLDSDEVNTEVQKDAHFISII